MTVINLKIKLKSRYLAILVCLGTTVSVSLNNYQPQQTVSVPTETEIIIPQPEVVKVESESYGYVTYSDFLRMEPGKTLGEVEAIVGKGRKVEISAEREVYRWPTENGWVLGIFDRNECLIKFKQDGSVDY